MAEWVKSVTQLFLFPFILDIVIALAVLLAAELTYRVAMRLLKHLRIVFPVPVVDSLTVRIATALQALLLLAAADIIVNSEPLPPLWASSLQLVLRLIITGAAGWLIVCIVLAIFDGMQRHYAWQGSRDNLKARRISTQLRLFRNTALFIIVTLTIIAAALSVPGLRTLGISLFASAGVAGIIIGIAARPALSNLLAGLQLALTQPIRIDDVVIIENEWGRIEEIAATFVVVRIWDERQMIVPLSYFIEHPFQNWTHTSSELLGTVFLYLDYTVPLAPLRAELQRIVNQSPLWDKRVCGMQVTDNKEKTVEVRALVSAADAGSLWDLRCEVREKLIDFLQKNHPSSLPRLRADVRETAA